MSLFVKHRWFFMARSPKIIRTLLSALAIVALSCLTTAPSAFAEEGLKSLRSAGMGDNVVAGAGANAGLFHNPAGIAAVTAYALELGYDTQLKTGDHQLGVSIADSQTNPGFAGGVAYTFGFNRGDEKNKASTSMDHNVRLSAALPLIQDTLYFGVTGQYLHYTRAGVAGVPDSRKLKHNGFTLDLGVMAKLGEKFFIGVSAQDLIYVDGATDARIIRAGAAGMFGIVRVLAEYGGHLKGAQTRHHGGAGVELMLQSFAMRTGFRHVSANDFERHENLLSFGLGYRGQTFGLDLAYRQHVQRAPDRFFGVSVVLFM